MLDAGELCNREVVLADPDEGILDAARRMRERDVGSLVVVEGPPEARRPIGILTDRDIVLYALASGGAIPARTVRDCMQPELVTAHEREGLFELIRRMRAHRIRRLPVVDDAGVLQGILSVDDVLEVVAEEVRALAELLAHGHERRPTPTMRGD